MENIRHVSIILSHSSNRPEQHETTLKHRQTTVYVIEDISELRKRIRLMSGSLVSLIAKTVPAELSK